jgi:hypothetical protein
MEDILLDIVNEKESPVAIYASDYPSDGASPINY